MPHIHLQEDLPGIRSLAVFRPETAQPLYALAQVLLRGESPLSAADRELIAAYVSHLNNCMFCMSSHAAAARCLYGADEHVVNDVLNDMQQANVRDELKALLHIAGKVQILGSAVTQQDIDAAKALGASDKAIHDTVLIAATFCMFNRYVDGLATLTPTDPAVYAAMGERMKNGYTPPQASPTSEQQ